jgi:hypothetical protein
MAGAAVRESATFAGRPDQVREARAFVGRLLGPSHPCRDVSILLVSEMVTNSLLHGGSGSGPGEAVTGTVVAWAAGVRVEVTGRKADGVPVLRRPDDEAEGSRGCSWWRSWPSGGATNEAAARRRPGSSCGTDEHPPAIAAGPPHSAVMAGPGGPVVSRT